MRRPRRGWRCRSVSATSDRLWPSRPGTRYWTLGFSTTTRPRLTVVPTCLAAAHGESRYTAGAHDMGEVLVETTTAEEAVAAAVRNLPLDLGPVTSGAV
ncbi:DUF6193 family natural product biosynthesis protein [Kitasatospora purpeofusca]|uniref:DUF6193 family natural product biosynthesis protein n=1 Tax=Kitasatospora purpeofusca TaxID=67352 RepID=UPI0035E0E768